MLGELRSVAFVVNFQLRDGGEFYERGHDDWLQTNKKEKIKKKERKK